MKLLLDQNLSPQLIQQLFDLFPDSKHVQSLGLERSSDIPLWDFAFENNFLIVTKDADFSERSAIVGYPPKIIWIRLGNCTPSEIESILRTNYEHIEAFNANNTLGVLALFG